MTQEFDDLIAFVRHDDRLYSQYLLFLDDHDMGGAPDDARAAYLFLCWYILYGRNFYAAAMVVPDAVRAAFWRYDATHGGFFQDYVAGEAKRDEAGAALSRWFYGEAIAAHGLAPWFGAEELDRLGRVDDDGECELDRLRGPARTAFDEQFSRAAENAGAPYPPAVSIVGLHRSVLGLGEEAREFVDALCEAGVLPELVDVSPPGVERDPQADRYKAFESARPRAPVVIFLLPPFEMMRAISRLDLRKPTLGQRWIGRWFWETTALPQRWRAAYDAVDEIWAASTFLRDVFRGETDKPVALMPSCVTVEADAADGLPDDLPDDLAGLFDGRFTVLTVFDFNSYASRKNPLGAIEAFRRAFPPDMQEVQLILKAIHGERRPDAMREIEDAIGDDERILLVDGVIPKPELCGLIARADAYVSLHRSEGFGRPIVEAMLLGTPVVATGWSGPHDFLSVRTGYPVASTLRDVEPGEYAYAAGQWAEPDLDMAAARLRAIYDDPQKAERIAAVAQREARAQFGRRRIARLLRMRLLEIGDALR